MKKGIKSKNGVWDKWIKNRLMLAYVVVITIIFTVGCAKAPKGLILSGSIEATEIDINSEVSGKIVKILKSEGDLLSEGESLVAVDEGAAKLQIKSEEAALKAANAKLDELRAGSRTEEIKQAEAAAEAAKANLDEVSRGSRSEIIAQDEAAYKQAKEGVNTAQKNYDYRMDLLKKYQTLFQGEAVTEQQVKDVQNAADSAYQQLVDAKAKLEMAKEKYHLSQSGATDEAIRAANANYKQALAKVELLKKGATEEAIIGAEASIQQRMAALETAKLQLSKYHINAPKEGILLYKNVEVGQFVSPGTVIGTIQGNEEYWIKVYLPQKYNNKVMLNQKVKIKTSALDGEDIEGTVIFKSPKAEFTPKNIETSESKEENTVVAVKVRIDTNKAMLSPGMSADVYID